MHESAKPKVDTVPAGHQTGRLYRVQCSPLMMNVWVELKCEVPTPSWFMPGLVCVWSATPRWPAPVPLKREWRAALSSHRAADALNFGRQRSMLDVGWCQLVTTPYIPDCYEPTSPRGRMTPQKPSSPHAHSLRKWRWLNMVRRANQASAL